ncbi:MAG: epoxyqueuosine reductase QueH [Enterocloster sp.]
MDQNNQKQNYQRVLENTLRDLERERKRPRLLLHSCCAPCSSYVLEYLSRYFSITVFYYNPNISPAEEYEERVKEQQRLIREMRLSGPVDFREGSYDPEVFYSAVKGHEKDREGGERCFICYEMRLRAAAEEARAGDYDFFTTTLSISPLKNAAKLNDIGAELAQEYKIPYLFSDFKKKNGYKRSVELSAEYGLYRQNYCGCAFSRAEAEEREKRAKSTNEFSD